jgi:hypothetical protein
LGVGAARRRNTAFAQAFSLEGIPALRHREALMHRYATMSAALWLVGASLAAAQTPAPQPGPAQPNSAAQAPCAPPAGGTVGSGQSDRNLSDKLANSNGVICPPENVDPDMQKPAPGGGRMKVIPPPGGPGGDQNVIPK